MAMLTMTNRAIADLEIYSTFDYERKQWGVGWLVTQWNNSKSGCTGSVVSAYAQAKEWLRDKGTYTCVCSFYNQHEIKWAMRNVIRKVGRFTDDNHTASNAALFMIHRAQRTTDLWGSVWDSMPIDMEHYKRNVQSEHLDFSDVCHAVAIYLHVIGGGAHLDLLNHR